jgi:hypothetical protein
LYGFTYFAMKQLERALSNLNVPNIEPHKVANFKLNVSKSYWLVSHKFLMFFPRAFRLLCLIIFSHFQTISLSFLLPSWHFPVILGWLTRGYFASTPNANSKGLILVVVFHVVVTKLKNPKWYPQSLWLAPIEFWRYWFSIALTLLYWPSIYKQKVTLNFKLVIAFFIRRVQNFKIKFSIMVIYCDINIYGILWMFGNWPL